MIFMSYEKFYRKNMEVLDALAGRYMDLGKHLTFRNLSNILISCSNMNYVNQILLEYIEKQLLRRIKSNIVQENEDVFDQTGASLLEKYSNQSHTYTHQEEELFQNILNLNKSQQEVQQQTESKKEFKSEELNLNSKQTKKQEAVDADIDIEQQEEVEEFDNNDDGFEILDITSDKQAIEKFQKDYDEQNKYLSNQKQQNSEIISNSRIKEHRYDKVEDLDPTNATMILISYCKMKVVKPELFEVLEANFSKKLDQANPKDVATYSYAHSMLCNELLNQFYDSKKKLLKRSLKNIKKYNHYFYEVVLPFVELNIEKYNCKQLQVIFTSASKPQVKKRAICRQIVEIGIKSIPKLANEAFSSEEERNIFIYKHFKLLTNFAITESMRKELVMTCYDNNIKIDELYKKYSHLLINNNIQNLSSNEIEDIQPLELQLNQQKNEQVQQKEEEEEDDDDQSEDENENKSSKRISIKNITENN